MNEQEVSVGSTGNSFIDENHDGLLEHLAKLSSLRDNNPEPDKVRSMIEGFITNLEQHFAHEEIVLKGAGYKNLRIHIVQHRMMALDMHKYLVGGLPENDAALFIKKITASILSHEMTMDQDYWPYFDDSPSGKTGLIAWQPEFETGDNEVDSHHQSLINHVNRFYIKVLASNDTNMACRELKLLCAYSEYHFQEEEKLLGAKLRLGHKEEHQRLLADLGCVINEIEAGKYQLKNLGGYLDFWLLNHIKMHDVPAFSNN